MKLLIVESPAKAKTIEKYLDGAYTVKASVGHVRDLPKSNKQAIDIDAGFVPHYEISKGKEHVLSEIKRLAKDASEVILATDPDREGEAIAWHIKEALKLKNAKRVTFNEITKEAVQEAMHSPRDIDENLRKAQEARRVLDRLVGYDLSGIVWKKVRYGLSAGRVQSPALRIIMEREREIRAFVPEDYFVLTGDFVSKDNKKNKATLTCVEEPKDRKEVERIVKEAKSGTWAVKSIEKSEVKRSPRAPFITSTLQQTASSRLGFSPSRTMMLAQRLYEAGHITYMRTDSTTLSKFALAGIARAVESNFGKDYLEFHNFDKKSKNAQEAHEAIRPSHFEKEVAGNDDDQKKLYHLIWQRAVASQMKEAKLMRTKVCANIKESNNLPAGRQVPDFAVNGSTIIFDGWLKADPGASGEEVILPAFKEDEVLNLADLHTEDKQTQPPGRYTEAGLVKELEKRGIGRPSTYASILRTLEERDYVVKENKSLKPTDTGDVVSTFLENNFNHYISDNFTAHMEEELDDIANGDADYVATLKEFYTPLHKKVKEKEKLDKATNMGEADSRFKCPKCESGMIVKLGRGGKFLSCSRYPDCDGALTFEGLEIKKDEPIGNHPETGLPIYVKTGKYGPYVQHGEMPAKPAKGTRRKKGDPKPEKPKMSSIPKEYDPTKISIDDALKFLSLPRKLGDHPDTGKSISANRGMFGPYVVHDGDFRSLKKDDVYEISLERALEILKEPKKVGRRRFKKKS